MSKKSFVGWYYRASFGSFGGIFFHANPCHGPGENDSDSDNEWGPFKTFGEAKADALGYFRSDLDTARFVMQDIRAYRKRDAQ